MADVYQHVTDQLLTMFEEGLADERKWRKSWSSLGLEHHSALGRTYNGVNRLLLSLTQQLQGYGLPVWGTYQQWKGLDAQVQRGEQGTKVVLWKTWAPKDDENDVDAERINRGRGAMMRMFTVFNVAQTNADPELYRPVTRNPDERNAAAETWACRSGATIMFGYGRACYIPLLDAIEMPDFEVFDDGPAYYGTLAHELAHWTGHSSRLARGLYGAFTTDVYAKEELIAELSACFSMARLGIEAVPRADHLHYLAGWCTAMKVDKKFITQVAGAAQRATAYLFGEHDLGEKAVAA